MQKIKKLTGGAYFSKDMPFFISRSRENYEKPRHVHDFLEIIIVEEGQGFHYINEEIIRVQKGDIFLLPLGNEHVFRPSTSSDENQLIIYNVLISSDKLGDLLKEADMIKESLIKEWLLEIKKENNGYIHLKDKQNQCLSLIRWMYLEFQSRQPGYQMILHAKLIELMIKLFRFDHYHPASQGVNEKNNLALEEVLSFIDENYNCQVSLNQLANMMLVSERQFAREFKKYTNQSFIKYIQNIRIEKSCHLLQSTDHTVQEICYMVGYCNIDYFRSLFIKKVGTPPGKYRKMKIKELLLAKVGS